jgi:lysophospholipase L1-like esterase
VSLGDSTAVGIGAGRGGGYPERLASRLRREGHSVGLSNFGQSGARVRDVFTHQVKRAVAAQPTLVTLAIGTNDIWRGTSVEDFQEDLDRIARRLKQTGAPLVVSNIADMALAPVARLVPSALYEGRIEPFNAAIAEVARAHGLHLVDLYEASKELIPRNPHFFSGDGFHPSEQGYEEWADLMLPVVRTLVGR